MHFVKYTFTSQKSNCFLKTKRPREQSLNYLNLHITEIQKDKCQALSLLTEAKTNRARKNTCHRHLLK